MSPDPTPEVLAADAESLLENYRPGDIGQRQLRDTFLEALRARPDAMWRDGPPDHFTASMFVFDDACERVCLVLHKKAQLWLQPGGHVEGIDQAVSDAAVREAGEETGLVGLRTDAMLVHLSHHALNSRFGRCRSHLDLRFATKAPKGATPSASDESEDVQWWPTADLPADTDDELRLVVPRVRDLLVRRNHVSR